MLNEHQILMQLASKHDVVSDILNKLPIQIASGNTDNKIRFDTYEHSSHAFTLSLDKLTYYNFRENKRGTLVDLISKFTDKPKEEVLAEIYMTIMLLSGVVDIECQEVGYEYKLEYPEVYDESELDIFPKKLSKLFLDDNVWLTTQQHWGIRYDYKRKRVVIPVYQDCELVGAIGRVNKTTLDIGENKYMPTLIYNKTRVLFGLDEYKDLIKKLKKVVLVESEKSVLKAWQYRLPFPVLAVGCSSISRHHIERLNILGVETIVWAQDKGIEEVDVLTNNLKRLKKFSNARNIKYLDSDSCDLLEDKECFLDKDLDIIKAILKDSIKDISHLLEGE